MIMRMKNYLIMFIRKLKILKLKLKLFLKPRYDQIYFDGVDWLDGQ